MNLKDKLTQTISLLVFLFISSCVSNKVSNKTASNYPPNIHEKRDPHKLVYAKKAIIFYASDDPKLLPYFYNTFTKRMNKENVFNAYRNRELDKLWYANSNIPQMINLESEIKNKTEEIKLVFLSGAKRNAYRQARTAWVQINQDLLNNPVAINSATYAEFAFWSALSLLNSTEFVTQPVIAYQKYSTLSQRSFLESKIDPPSLVVFNKIKNNLAKVPEKQIHILTENNCSIFINGQLIQEKTSLFLPNSLKSFLSARCTSGFYFETFIPAKKSKIQIQPYIPEIFRSMPAISALPKEQITRAHVQAIILIYWSHFQNYIDSVVLDAFTFNALRSTRIPLSTNRERNIAGDKLMSFLSDASKKVDQDHISSVNDLS